MKEYVQQPLFGKAYYNTNKEEGATLVQSEETAQAQNDNVYKLFQEFRMLAPSECWKLYRHRYNDKVLLTSIRRAITTLTVHKTFGGKLIKTNVRHKGIYGKTEFVWKLND